MKVACRECGKLTPHTDEYYPRTNRGKLSKRCRPCTYSYNSQWKKDNVDKIRAYYKRVKPVLDAKRKAERHLTCKSETLYREALKQLGFRICGRCKIVEFGDNKEVWGKSPRRCRKCHNQDSLEGYYRRKAERNGM